MTQIVPVGIINCRLPMTGQFRPALPSYEGKKLEKGTLVYTFH